MPYLMFFSTRKDNKKSKPSYAEKHAETVKIDSYKKLFDNETPHEKTKAAKALEIALETRKFEIQHYWIRAAYFWAFIVAIFAAIVKVLEFDNGGIPNWFSVPLSLLGFYFSLGWYWVNKGSKYWQENWERHVYNLEDDVIGPLFKYSKTCNKKPSWLFSHPFSVSKINALLSLLVTIFWGVMFLYTISFYAVDPLLKLLGNSAIILPYLLSSANLVASLNQLVELFSSLRPLLTWLFILLLLRALSFLVILPFVLPIIVKKYLLFSSFQSNEESCSDNDLFLLSRKQP
jgi:hypothetical protein